MNYLSDPEIINDTKKLREYSKEQSDIQETVMTYKEYKSVERADSRCESNA